MRDEEKTKEQLIDELAQMRRRVAELEDSAPEKDRVTESREDSEPLNEHLVDGKYSIKDLVDIERLRKIFERFSVATGFTIGFVEHPNQEILIATGWRDICTKFHRAFPESAKHCKTSNIYLMERLKELKQLSMRPCENGLVDGATPIIIQGKHIANLATGQAFFREPDLEHYRKLGLSYGYNVEDYLEAVRKVPVVSEKQFKEALSFLSELAVMIAELGLANLVIKRHVGELEEQIYERKRVEAALRESERKFRAISDSAQDAIVMIDDHGAVTFWNTAAERTFGYSAAEMLGKNVHSLLIPKNNRNTHLDALEKFGRTGRGEVVGRTVELRAVRKNTENFPIELSLSAFQVDDRWHAAGIIRDITARKLSEEALRESEGKLRSILRTAPVGIGLTVNGIIMEANDALCDMTGYSREELIHKERGLVYPGEEESERVRLEYRRRISETGSFTIETRWRKKDGRTIDVLLSATPVDPDDPSSGVTFTALDITERVRAEAEKEQLQYHLRRAQKLEAIGTLAGGIAHDFNNILGPIIGYTEMALEDIPHFNPLRRDLEMVISSAHRARDLVKQILAFSRHGREQKRIPMEIGSILREALKLMRATLPTTIELSEHIESGVVLADATQIHQVFVNLCTNAAHAMNDRGTLGVSLTRVDLDEKDLATPAVRELKPGPCLKLSVSDTGCGMDAATIERIFDPYFTTKEVGKGSGLGLAVVHGIVKRHEGAITVESEPGRGSTFNVYLPALDLKTTISPESRKPPPTGSERVLIVDDEQAMVELGTKMLQRLGYQVVAVTDSREALDIFLSKPREFDLVITDYTMPRLTGTDLARAIRRTRADIPIILCTGFNHKTSESDMAELGVSVIMKPYDMRQMAKLIRTVLDPGP